MRPHIYWEARLTLGSIQVLFQNTLGWRVCLSQIVTLRWWGGRSARMLVGVWCKVKIKAWWLNLSLNCEIFPFLRQQMYYLSELGREVAHSQCWCNTWTLLCTECGFSVPIDLTDKLQATTVLRRTVPQRPFSINERTDFLFKRCRIPFHCVRAA